MQNIAIDLAIGISSPLIAQKWSGDLLKSGMTKRALLKL